MLTYYGDSVAQRLSIGVRERVLEFLARYGEKGFYVLKAAVEACIEGRSARRGVRLGDFSYREVAARLREYGLEYNPSNLLSLLEREYAVIETTYRSSGQHWWRFIDLDAVIEALDAYERGSQGVEGGAGAEPGYGAGYDPAVEEQLGAADGLDGGEIDDPQVEVIRAQIAALNPHELLARLRLLASKPRLTSYDRRLFSKIAFEELELVASVLEKARAYPEHFSEEIRVLESILRLASLIARKLMAAGRAGLKTEARPSIAARRAMT